MREKALIINKGDNYISVDLQGDMGGNTRLRMLQQDDGDVILSIYTVDAKEIQNSIEFCTFAGGSGYPVIAKKLRELIKELLEL